MRIMKTHLLLMILAVSAALPGRAAEIPQTERTRGLVKELLMKLDSTGVYAARKEKKIEDIKSGLPGDTDEERYSLCYDIAEEYSNYILDSALVYMEKAELFARETGNDSRRIDAELKLTELLTVGGFYYEANEILAAIPRNTLKGKLLVQYYNAWTLLFHELYSSSTESAGLKEKYRARYNVYRDSMLCVADTLSSVYLRNMERKEARLGNFDEARRYNAFRYSLIKDHRSGAYATCVYDRFLISYYYEKKLTGEAVDDLLESAIIEVENSNHNIASLLRVEALLINFNEVEAAKKVSDYYYSSLQQLGSRKRLLEGGQQAIRIMERNQQLLEKRKNELLAALAFISLLVVALVFMLVIINSSRLKISGLKDNLQRSAKISKRYIGVLFQLYSSYIKRLDTFRMKIHSNHRKGNVEQAIELTSPLGDFAAEERKELFNNFDIAFVDIFPDFIETVNGCLKPEEQIVPKKTEILTTELRILALIKLGIEDSTEIAELLHCSVKTVYNLRSVLKSRLAIPEEEFKSIIFEL